MNELERNLRISQEVHPELAWNGRTVQQGDFVALLDGRIVAVTRDVDETIEALRSLDPDPKRGMVVEVSSPGVDIIRGVR